MRAVTDFHDASFGYVAAMTIAPHEPGQNHPNLGDIAWGVIAFVLVFSSSAIVWVIVGEFLY